MIFDEGALARLVTEAVRVALREAHGATGSTDEYLSVARAAALAESSSAWIRTQVKLGRLTRFGVGRELRVRRSELTALLGAAPDKGDVAEESVRQAFKAIQGGRR